jgi:surface-anchored protein
MKKAAVCSLLSAIALSLNGATLVTGHVDLGIGYADGVWDLHVHDGVNDIEFEPDDVVLQVGESAKTTVPGTAGFAFLGNAGDPIWILPQAHNHSLLFLGIAAEEIDSGVFQNNQVALSLKAVSGPGHFSLYQTDGFGSPVVFINTRDGIDANDYFTLSVGSHSHANWAFSAPGAYTLSFEGSGTLADGGVFTSSGPVDFSFQVVPEPGTSVLLGVGIAAMYFSARRRRVLG